MSDDGSASQQAVIVERSFDAPVELVWLMWTDPQHFAAWYGPEGVTVTVAKMEVRPGGTRLFCMAMQTPNGPMEMWFVGEYREVVENARLVYTEALSDEFGNVSTPAHAGAPAGHQTTTEVSVELEEIAGGTKMLMTHTGIPADSPGAAGWAMAFDKLGARVAQHSNRF
jgi:uncharacterized protein YndB with AHSA1/START domain